jgi:hypothetical protein
MKELETYLSTFKTIIDNLIHFNKESKNVRLGGSIILKTYGLNFSRKVGDLDLIITNPNKEQRAYVKGLKINNKLSSSYYYHDNVKIFKNNLCLNILLVDPCYKNIVNNISYKFGNVEYILVPINEILDAKKSYKRNKDITDFLMLKNENFNI